MEEKKKLTPLRFAFNVIVGVVLTFLLIFIVADAFRPHECFDARKMICISNLKHLGVAFLMYQKDNKIHPRDNWCDTLKPYYKDTQLLQCLIDEIGPSSYAMNENIPADTNELPGDLVLLFESAPGWNQIGGPDDVVTDRHGRPGANIAFADGHVEFVDADDIPTLRWTIEQ